MCKNACNRFTRRAGMENYYCQNCARYIPIDFIHREKKSNGRLRCSCCNGLVRNKPKIFACKANAIQI
jgi:hypothetical protein